jgi:hypothetical protein
MRSLRLASLALAATFAAPSLAHAHLKLGGDGERVERKGFMVGFSLLPGMMRSGKSFAPAMRFRYHLGAGVHEAVTIATEFGIHKPLGIKAKKIGFDVDVVLTGYLGRFFVRGGVGVATWAYAAARDPFKPGVGGLVGIGWEFPLGRRVGLGVGIDYDARVRNDRQVAQTVLFGLRLNAYPKK